MPLHPATGRPSHRWCCRRHRSPGKASQSRSQDNHPNRPLTFVQVGYEKPVGAGPRQDRPKIAE